MSSPIYSYSTGIQFRKIIQELAKEFHSIKSNIRFVIPSRKDRIWWPLHDNGNASFILWTWQDIYENISSQKRRRVLSPPDHLLILKSILNDSLKNHSDKSSALPGLQRSGFLAVLSDDIRELLNEAVKPGQLPSDPQSNNPSEFLLPEIYSEYLSYLERFELLDSAQVYSAAFEALSENQEWGENLIIIFAGFLSFNHAQLELVNAIRNRCSKTIIIKPEADMSGFHDAGSQLGFPKSHAQSSGNILEISSAEPGLEPEIIARSLALWADGKLTGDYEFPGFDSIGLMIDEGREEIFAEALKRYGIPYDFSEGITVSRTLAGKILSSLHTLSSRNFPAYDTAVMLTQSCFAGSKFPVMRAYRAGCSGIENWKNYLSERAGDPDEKLHDVFAKALLSIEAIGKFCDTLESAHTPAVIMSAFNEFLHTPGLWLERYDNISHFPELDESLRLTASAVQTVSDKALSLHELMPDIGRVQDDKLKGDSAYEYLADWCRNSHVRAPLQLSSSVRIFTGQPPVLASFPVWIMSGVTQKSWSPNMKSSPLLGNEERERLRENEAYLPRTKEKAEQREALFRRLIQTGEDLTIISRPLLDDEGRPVSASPFMQKFLDDMKDWKIKRIDSEGINILLGSDGFRFNGIDPELKTPREVPCVKINSDFVGASDIQELLECPFLWFQRRKAQLYQPDSELVSPAEWGNMLHKYWESVWKIYRSDMTASGTRFTGIAKNEWARLMKADDEDYGRFAFLVKDKRLTRRLKGVEFRAERLAGVQGLILDVLHEDYEHEMILLEDEAHLRCEVDGTAFLGQCDRIEFLRKYDGSVTALITDYKEGRMSSKSYDSGMKNITGKSWNTDSGITAFKHGLQLSLYAAMFNERYGYDVSGVCILGHEDGRIWGTFSGETAGIFGGFLPLDDNGKNIKPDTDIAGRVNEGRYAMSCAASILKGGEFKPDYESERCRHCHIRSVCRKGEFRGEMTGSDDDGEDNV